jgi:copper chaperone
VDTNPDTPGYERSSEGPGSAAGDAWIRSKGKDLENDALQEREEMNETKLVVQDMSCGHCVATVQGALEQVDGVDSVVVSLETKMATVFHHGEIDTYFLEEAVQAVGFTPELRP